jgi:hypothetical protein
MYQGGVKRDNFISELSLNRVFDQDFRKRQLPKFRKNILCGGSCLGPTTLPHEHPVYAGWNVKIWIQKAYIYPWRRSDDDRAQTYLPPKWPWKGENRNTRGSGKSRPCLMQNRIPLHRSNFLATKTATKNNFKNSLVGGGGGLVVKVFRPLGLHPSVIKFSISRHV